MVNYRFDIGTNVWAKSPAPAGNTTGKETTRLYDSIGRLDKETVLNTGAYTRYEYPTNQIQSKVYSTVIDTNNNGADSNDEVMSESWTDGAGRVRKSRTEHPNSTGGWTGSLVEYDILGQVTRSTVPTEINSNYEPAGDDATRGWLWSSQEYDWKGRTTRTINTDGTDTLASYEGCGCAGGQVTTIQSELVPRDDQPTVNARRTQRIYADILGRSYKTEVLNWDGVSAYTTTVQTFNGRDQVTNTRQYAGSGNSSTFQDVTITYDGHGRMKTRHYPVEDANTNTTWIYNADDSIQQIVDPRNAITNFTYDNRGLTTQISYSVPNGSTIPVTPTVNFSYDALGNRTEMTDGTGTTTYSYNDLSQLSSETKDFTDLTNNLTISYTYNLGGGLKSITDPFSSSVNYTSDKTGRLTAVTGTAWAQNTTGHYASNIKYRAFGQIKQMDYDLPNETPQIKMDYDNRLRVTHFEAPSASESGGYLLKSDFTYTADSRVQAKDDLLDNKWDRTMKYDHAGRLAFNQFGIGQGSDNSSKRVYEQTIGYDAFSQMIERDTTHWNVNGGFTATYINGRQQDPNVSYDVAGNIVHEAKGDTNSFQDTTIDAAGRRSEMLERWHIGNGGQESFFVFEKVTKQGYDGDGRLVKSGKASRRVNITPTPSMPEPVYEYQIWSSVLGASLTSVLSNGSKFETKVFAGGALIATQRHVVENNQNYDSIDWTTADPVTGTIGRYSYTSAGNTGFKEETEPLGQKISLQDTADAPTPQNGGPAGRADDPEWQCQVYQAGGIDFYDMPVHCQIAADKREGVRGFMSENKKGNPQYINININKIRPPTAHGSEKMMIYTLSATPKKTGG